MVQIIFFFIFIIAKWRNYNLKNRPKENSCSFTCTASIAIFFRGLLAYRERLKLLQGVCKMCEMTSGQLWALLWGQRKRVWLIWKDKKSQKKSQCVCENKRRLVRNVAWLDIMTLKGWWSNPYVWTDIYSWLVQLHKKSNKM